MDKSSFFGRVISRLFSVDVSEIGELYLESILDELSSLKKPTKSNTVFALRVLKSRPQVSRPSGLTPLSHMIGPGILLGPVFIGGLLFFAINALDAGYSFAFDFTVTHTALITLGVVTLMWGLTYTPLVNITRRKNSAETEPTEFVVWGTDEPDVSPATNGE